MQPGVRKTFVQFHFIKFYLLMFYIYIFVFIFKKNKPVFTTTLSPASSFFFPPLGRKGFPWAKYLGTKLHGTQVRTQSRYPCCLEL